jgi:2-dehydro-3-deoxygluconokinase
MNIKPKEQCRWDLVSLGEMMLRLDPGDRRIWTTRHFEVSEGGGEYNVARGLKRCFGLDTADRHGVRRQSRRAAARGPDLPGRRGPVAGQVGGVRRRGRTVRNGLNFTERGFGVRAALGCSDRGHTAASQLKPGDIDWDDIFGELGARWFHTGGIFCALSESTPAVAIEAIKAARRTASSAYDLNYRDSLWKSIGGKKKAQEVNRALAPYMDVMIGNEEDFSAALGI